MLSSFRTPPVVSSLQAISLDVGAEPASPECPIPRTSYPGLSLASFSSHVAKQLSVPLLDTDIEILTTGVIYQSEVKIRRTLNDAFGAGAWVILPRRPPTWLTSEEGTVFLREFALFCEGRIVAEVIGDHVIEQADDLNEVYESARSRALRRCCKDLGVGSELWDPEWIATWKENNAVKVTVSHVVSGATKSIWRRKGALVGHPWREL